MDTDKPHRCPGCWRVWTYYPDKSRKYGWRWFGVGGRIRWWHKILWWRCPYCGLRFAAWGGEHVNCC
ncbi:hypothetical protein JRC04_05100 [Mycolicibacterium sp. S2-37]|uniref:hypothetical protein n=1 Tax=Mycolicibacterium sp. S2-37 TaxID=2810297 RepID=UPI001A945B05|nr:hypothetical protein [Mycolicibacterium sp. S2-37]MBO0676835.1 hypothetical protein [Mycolicibacterium sp. S2-37]